ncbi:MAG TPA: hypothetical protein DCE81_10695 [Cytophagales bacterium]|nr:hypothetical protein [Cytophagales bacterium]
MRSSALFIFALAINAITLLVSARSVLTIFEPTRNFDGSLTGATLGDTMTAYRKLMLWLIPLGFILIITLGIWLRAKGKLLAANLLLSVSAFPMLAGIVFWGGLALLFILFGK